MKRPELRRILKDIEAGGVNMVMVCEVSRLSRSTKDFAEIWEFLQVHKCGFISLSENFDTSTAAGEMLLFSIANYAQFERRMTSERVSASFLARAQRGLWNGGVLPMGYEPDPATNGSLKINEEEAKTVRLAFQALIEQGSVSEAARWLNKNGYTYHAPLRCGGYRPRHRHFMFDSLYRLLSNKTYAGIRVIRTKDNTHHAKAIWPAIVDMATFEKAQKILEAGRKVKTGRESRYPYLLSTRIFCAECGVPLIGISAHGNTTKVPYYGHGSQIKREQQLTEKGHRCNPFRIPARKLEERVWQEVVSLIQSESHREPLFQAIRKLKEDTAPERQIEKKEIDCLTITEKLANLARRVADLPEGVPADAFYAEMKRLNESRARLAGQIREIRQRGADQEVVTEVQYLRLLERLRTQLEAVSPEVKRRIAQTLIHRVVVTEDGFELHYFVGMEQIEKGEAFASPSFSLNKKFFGQSSFKGLNGGPCRT